METASPAHHVFVDFENVPFVDLGLIAGQPARVTLLIGKGQRKLDLPLVQQIRRLAAQVDLIEVGASGRNALDFTLAYYLGQAARQSPGVQFFIVSRDKDFDPLITHLRGTGLQVSRHNGFDDLPFLAPPSPPKASVAPRRSLTRPAAGPARTSTAAPGNKLARLIGGLQNMLTPTAAVPTRSSAVPTRATAPADKLARLIDGLQHMSRSRPVRRKTLLAHIDSFFAHRLTDEELDAVVEDLVRRGVIAIDTRGRVTY